MVVIREEIPVKYGGMFLQKVSSDTVPQITDFGQLTVLFIDEDTDIFKISVPTYYQVKPIDDNNISQFENLQKATYRSSFINITNKMDWNHIEENMFVAIIDQKTRELIQMTNLIDFNMDCTEYFYQNLDSGDCEYPTKPKQKRYQQYMQ